MNRLSGGAAVLLAGFFLTFSGGSALAQSADGILDTIKGMVSNPVFGSFLMSKIGSPSSLLSHQNNQQATYPDLGSDQNPNPNLAQFPSMPTTPYLPQGAVTPFGQSNSPMTIINRLAPSELRELSRHDISVLIDKSGSMSTCDCPSQFAMGGNISRWEWCREQSSVLMQQTVGALPAGITIVPFAGNWQRYDNVMSGGINSIFNNSAPGGSTNLAAALQSELDRYFMDRDLRARRQPLMIAVITDGVPDSKSAVRRVIRAATEHMNSSDEIKIVFFMIGNDQNGAEFIDELSGRLANEGARFNVVSMHSFAEVNQRGLAHSLAASAME